MITQQRAPDDVEDIATKPTAIGTGWISEKQRERGERKRGKEERKKMERDFFRIFFGMRSSLNGSVINTYLNVSTAALAAIDLKKKRKEIEKERAKERANSHHAASV